MQLAAATLTHARVRLEPFEPNHRAGLIAAAEADVGIFRHMPFPIAEKGYSAWFDWLRAEQEAERWMPFAVIAALPPPFTGVLRNSKSVASIELPPPNGGRVGRGGVQEMAQAAPNTLHPARPLPLPPLPGAGARSALPIATPRERVAVSESESAGREAAGGGGEKIVGQSCYLALRPKDAGVEIGGTWYKREAQGTAVNPVAKLLLLDHAFACGAERVEFKTDALNTQSRAALTKLGAHFEGIFRRQMRRPDGSMRDNAYFSVIREEWPALKARIEARLAGVG